MHTLTASNAIHEDASGGLCAAQHPQTSLALVHHEQQVADLSCSTHRADARRTPCNGPLETEARHAACRQT
jgi:hypothetical protein